MMEILVTKTGNKILVECARDCCWGTRVPLADPDCLNPTKWLNQGILGELLEEIREEYQADVRMLTSLSGMGPSEPSEPTQNLPPIQQSSVT